LKSVAQRLRDEASPELQITLWTATTILVGLRHTREQVGKMIEGVTNVVLRLRVGLRPEGEEDHYEGFIKKNSTRDHEKGSATG
jgi:hypothetical protein